MHARIDHLLSIRDGQPVEADIAEHVTQCVACAAEVRRLSLTREQLQALPQTDAAPESWERIQSRVNRPRASGWQRRVAMVAASAAVVTLSIIASLALREASVRERSSSRAASNQSEAQSSSRNTTHVDELVAQSQQLEQLLQTLPERPRIERVSTAATIDTLEGRIQWLDFRLSYAPDEGLSDEQARRLWRERVELMDSLVKVRYAEAGQSSF
jgi:hypothetical protein